MSPPFELLSVQNWFGAKIVQRLSQTGAMLPLTSQEVDQFISPSQTLSAEKRLEIYNQQYWWRLISVLQENFPALTRLFGYTDFNELIAVPFLERHPPKHWLLSSLGDRLVDWLDEEYTKKDRPLVLAMATLDWAYQEVFFAPFPVSTQIWDVSGKIALQKHVRLFQFPFDLFSFREALLEKPVEYWHKTAFPTLTRDRNYFFILYRNEDHTLSYREMEPGEWALLDGIDQGLTLEESCNVLERKGGVGAMQAQHSLVAWVQEWINRKWLA